MRSAFRHIITVSKWFICFQRCHTYPALKNIPTFFYDSCKTHHQTIFFYWYTLWHALFYCVINAIIVATYNFLSGCTFWFGVCSWLWCWMCDCVDVELSRNSSYTRKKPKIIQNHYMHSFVSCRHTWATARDNLAKLHTHCHAS